jgi:hypothetical protein
MSSILNLSSVPEIGIPSGRTHGSRKHHNWKLNLLSYQRERESEREREGSVTYSPTALKPSRAYKLPLLLLLICNAAAAAARNPPRLAAIWAPLTSHNTGFFGKPTNPPKDYYCTTYKHFVIAVCVGPKFRWRLRRGALPA